MLWLDLFGLQGSESARYRAWSIASWLMGAGLKSFFGFPEAGFILVPGCWVGWLVECVL